MPEIGADNPRAVSPRLSQSWHVNGRPRAAQGPITAITKIERGSTSCTQTPTTMPVLKKGVPNRRQPQLVALVCGALMLPLLLQGMSLSHVPEAPSSGDSVLIQARIVGPPFQSSLFLHYQVVAPGAYISADDPAFKTRWETVPMRDDGLYGDAKPSDGVFTGRIPSDHQQHRHLIRYQVTDSATPSGKLNHRAYFVYDGVPDWHGAINPNSSRTQLREPRHFPAAALTRLPVYHLISHRQSIHEATWQPPRRGANDNAYHHRGTLVYQGVVYDHIRFRARGGVWRHAMGKNMWKFNFRSEQPFQAYDAHGRPFSAPWDKLNLGACIQQGQYGTRGEHGMFDALSYRLFNLAGTPAPRTFWIHLRIISDAEEAPKDQYEGDFWGLYLAVENLDGAFVKNHGLPEGNLYKIEHSQPYLRYAGNPFVSPPLDAQDFLRQVTRSRPDPVWWENHADLDRYYRYRSIVECVHHYDIAQGKNYYFFHDSAQQRWITIPWDVDLTWGDHMYGSGRDPFYRAGALRGRTSETAYLERLATIRDLLFNREAMYPLIDEMAAQIDPPQDAAAMVDADRAKWDYHPIMRSRYVMRHQAGQGKYYFGEAHASFEVMVDYLKRFVETRGQWIDRTLLSQFQGPDAPEIQLQSANDVLSGISNNGQKLDWRLADVTPNNPATGQAGHYEINALATAPSVSEFPIPSHLLKPGHHYRIRARIPGTRERPRSRWSVPVTFNTPESAGN